MEYTIDDVQAEIDGTNSSFDNLLSKAEALVKVLKGSISELEDWEHFLTNRCNGEESVSTDEIMEQVESIFRNTFADVRTKSLCLTE